MRRSQTVRRPTGLALVAALLAVVMAATWDPPRAVAPPGPDASPEEVVRTYFEALDARDFETADAIDASDGPSSAEDPLTADDLVIQDVLRYGADVHVLFTADFSGGDGSLQDGLWGYYLRRGGDGLWHIVDAGVV